MLGLHSSQHPTTVLWMAITGPRHQAVEEILPSNSIWLFGKLNRQSPWWLWSCLWVCPRVWLLMADLDLVSVFILPSFLRTFWASEAAPCSTRQMLPSGSLMALLYFSKYSFPLLTCLTEV